MTPTTAQDFNAENAFNEWLTALEARHLASLTRSELTRALRALSSCYVERRNRLTSGSALDGAGKRAAFALFYAPLHFLTLSRIVRSIGGPAQCINSLLDYGCGTGAAGAAWALACDPPPSITGVDRHPWAVDEARWTYRHFNLRGRAHAGDVTTIDGRTGRASAIVLAYTVNELSAEKRGQLLTQVIGRARKGTTVLIVEPIARGVTGWWTEWAHACAEAGGRADEWRFPAELPRLLSEIAIAAGLNPRELTARSLYIQATPTR